MEVSRHTLSVVAMGMRLTPQEVAWLARLEQHMKRVVRDRGCFISSVIGEGASPPFAYTVGLFGIGHPELIVFGLDAESACGTLYWFFDEVKRGRVLAPDEIVSPPGSDTRFLVERFPNPGSAVFAANRFYGRSRRSSVPVYQLTWDVAGAFPWEEGYRYPATLQPRPGDFVEWLG